MAKPKKLSFDAVIELIPEKIKTILAQSESVYCAEIFRILKDLPFEMDAPCDTSKITGVHFEYAWDTYSTTACPINDKIGYCGSVVTLKSYYPESNDIFPEDFNEQILALGLKSDSDDIEDELSELKCAIFSEWFTFCWKRNRNANLNIKGYLSIHDTNFRLDLDTGIDFSLDDSEIIFFPEFGKK